MTSSVTVEDDDFLARFESCELPEAQWTHLAHIRVAWIYLSKFSPETALQQIRNGILRYNTNVLGKRREFHETVTVAFTCIVASRMTAGERWTQFAGRIGDVFGYK